MVNVNEGYCLLSASKGVVLIERFENRVRFKKWAGWYGCAKDRAPTEPFGHLSNRAKGRMRPFFEPDGKLSFRNRV